mgnify:CR=1 FL=1
MGAALYRCCSRSAVLCCNCLKAACGEDDERTLRSAFARSHDGLESIIESPTGLGNDTFGRPDASTRLDVSCVSNAARSRVAGTV